mmetsp:Transcript_39359/g.92057  ORF Transcript_39359/g.92057 Transcript_39359/m.92057 type:complete len:306 (-) Transcript_39359:783-1700(-)
MSLDVKVDRVDRVYHPGDKVRGTVIIHAPSAQALVHDGVSVRADGMVNMQLSSKAVGLFEAFYSGAKPIVLLSWQQELAAAGKLAGGTSELPFAFTLNVDENEKLFETYHGVFINVQYCICVEVKRGMLAKSLKKQLEFVVEVPEEGAAPKAVPRGFSIVPDSLENVKKEKLHRVPAFKFVGCIDSVLCDISQPLTGEVTVVECSAPVKSIELQLVRIETCHFADGVAREATEIQNIQIADGPVCHGWPIPVYMVFPRLFTCPTASARLFKLEFELILVVVFTDGHLLTEKFPLKLVRRTDAKPH